MPTNLQPPVPPEVWAPVVRRLLGDGPAVRAMTLLQEGQSRAAVLAALTLDEETYFLHLGAVHDAAVEVVKAAWAFERLRHGTADLSGLAAEDRLVAETIRLHQTAKDIAELVARVPIDTPTVIRVLTALP